MTARDVLPELEGTKLDARLEYSIDLPVLGICTRFETNSRDVHELTLETFGAWKHLSSDAQTPYGQSVQVRTIVRDGHENTDGRSPIQHTLPDALRVIARSAGSVGISDPERAEATALVTTELVADRDHFRDEMLQALTLALLSSYDRHFLHAAAIKRGRRAVLLAAQSGTGKSTLAYVAHRAGIQVMSEDRVWIQQEPALQVWGWPMHLHLRPEAAEHFPEVGGLPLHARGARDVRHLVSLATSERSAPPFHADEITVCLLTRGEDPPSIERVSAVEIVEALTHDVAPGFDRHTTRHRPAMQAIAGDGGWRMRLSPDPHEALPLLEHILGYRSRE